MNCHHVFKLNHMQNVAQTAQNLSIIIYLSETSSGCDIYVMMMVVVEAIKLQSD